MTEDVTTVPAELLVGDVAALLLQRGISGAPVVDGRGHIIGVVSHEDLVSALSGDSLGRSRSRAWRRRRRHQLTARDLMSSPALVVAADRSVAHAATVMTARGVGRLPVVEADRLVGIVTRGDLVRAFARDDAAIEQEIWSDIVLRGVYVNPRGLELKVEGGRVELSGEVETRGKARRLVEYVERVPGVISVHSDVTWRLNDGPPKGVPPARAV